MATKKSKSENSKNPMTLTLGDSQSMGQYDAAASGDSAPHRLKYDSHMNMYVLLDPEILAVAEHWLTVGEETFRLVCNVQAKGLEMIMNKWGYADGCPICSLKKELFETTDKDSKDELEKAKRRIARDIQSQLAIYMLAIKGEGYHTKIRGKLVTKPDFSKAILVPRKLKLSRSAFDTLKEEFEKQGFLPKDVRGLPVNFVGGKNEGGFSKIMSVELFPQDKLKDLPKFDLDFGDLGMPNPERLEEVFKQWEKEEFPQLLTGVKSRKSKSVKGKGRK